MYTLKNIHYTEILTIDDAKIGSSGNYVQIGSSGSAKIGSSGDDAFKEAIERITNIISEI